MKKAHYPVFQKKVQTCINVMFCSTNDWVVYIFNKDEVPVREKKEKKKKLQNFLHAWSQMHIS